MTRSELRKRFGADGWCIPLLNPENQSVKFPKINQSKFGKSISQVDRLRVKML